MEVVGGEGAYVHLKNGDKWLDLGSLSYQANLGHGHQEMIDAVKAQADELCLSAPNVTFPAKEQCAKSLLKLAPKGFDRVFFTLGGAEAIENAMKISRLYTGRHKFLSRYKSYHGATFGALSLTGDFRRPPLEPGLSGVAKVLRDSDIPATLDAEQNVAAVFLESIQGANGVHLSSKESWSNIKKACKKHGALLCVDEVLAGFGRTGKVFGFEHYDVEPDLICVAKALTGGYVPMGAVLVHERISKRFDKEVLWAGLTHYSHPLGCAAATKAMEIYERDGLYQKGKMLEPVLLKCLRSLEDALPKNVSNARGLGALAAIDLAISDVQWESLQEALNQEKLLVHAYPRRGTLVLSPPLVIEEATLNEGLGRFANAITSVVL